MSGVTERLEQIARELLAHKTIDFADVMRALAAARQESWVPVSERMPPGEDGADTSRTRAVLFVVDVGESGRIISLGCWEPADGVWLDTETDGMNDRIEWAPGEVTHWRELPGLPSPPQPSKGADEH